MCAKGHYLAEKPSFNLDGTVQKQACGLWRIVLKEIALGELTVILNAKYGRWLAHPNPDLSQVLMPNC